MIVVHKKYHEEYNADGTRDGPGPTFREHLDSAEGQAEVQALRARMEARLRKERRQARLRLERMKAGLQKPAAPVAGNDEVRLGCRTSRLCSV